MKSCLFLRESYVIKRLTYSSFLAYSDQKLVDSASKSIQSIIEWASKTPKLIEKVVTEDLLKALLVLIESPTTTATVFSNIITTFTCIVKNSPEFTLSLLKNLKVADILYKAMTGTSFNHLNQLLSVKDIGVLINRSPTELTELLALISEFLPPLSLITTTIPTLHQTTIKLNMESFSNFSSHFLPVLVDLYGASVDGKIKLSVIEFVCKVVNYVDFSDFASLEPLSGLLSSVFSGRQKVFSTINEGNCYGYFKTGKKAEYLSALQGCVFIVHTVVCKNYADVIQRFSREGYYLNSFLFISKVSF